MRFGIWQATKPCFAFALTGIFLGAPMSLAQDFDPFVDYDRLSSRDQLEYRRQVDQTFQSVQFDHESIEGLDFLTRKETPFSDINRNGFLEAADLMGLFHYDRVYQFSQNVYSIVANHPRFQDESNETIVSKFYGPVFQEIDLGLSASDSSHPKRMADLVAAIVTRLQLATNPDNGELELNRIPSLDPLPLSADLTIRILFFLLELDYRLDVAVDQAEAENNRAAKNELSQEHTFVRDTWQSIIPLLFDQHLLADGLFGRIGKFFEDDSNFRLLVALKGGVFFEHPEALATLAPNPATPFADGNIGELVQYLRSTQQYTNAVLQAASEVEDYFLLRSILIVDSQGKSSQIQGLDRHGIENELFGFTRGQSALQLEREIQSSLEADGADLDGAWWQVKRLSTQLRRTAPDATPILQDLGAILTKESRIRDRLVEALEEADEGGIDARGMIFAIAARDVQENFPRFQESSTVGPLVNSRSELWSPLFWHNRGETVLTHATSWVNQRFGVLPIRAMKSESGLLDALNMVASVGPQLGVVQPDLIAVSRQLNDWTERSLAPWVTGKFESGVPSNYREVHASIYSRSVELQDDPTRMTFSPKGALVLQQLRPAQYAFGMHSRAYNSALGLSQGPKKDYWKIYKEVVKEEARQQIYGTLDPTAIPGGLLVTPRGEEQLGYVKSMWDPEPEEEGGQKEVQKVSMSDAGLRRLFAYITIAMENPDNTEEALANPSLWEDARQRADAHFAQAQTEQHFTLETRFKVALIQYIRESGPIYDINGDGRIDSGDRYALESHMADFEANVFLSEEQRLID